MKRYICNLALEDLPEVLEPDEDGHEHCLFLNKFDLSVNSSASAVSCVYFHHMEVL